MHNILNNILKITTAQIIVSHAGCWIYHSTYSTNLFKLISKLRLKFEGVCNDIKVACNANVCAAAAAERLAKALAPSAVLIASTK